MKKGSKPSLHHIHVHRHTSHQHHHIYIYVCIHKYPIAQTIQNSEAKRMSDTIEMYLCEWFSISREKWRSEGIWNLSNKFQSLPYFIFRQKRFLRRRPTVSKVVLSTVAFQAVFRILFSGYVYICVLECFFSLFHGMKFLHLSCCLVGFSRFYLLLFNHSMIENRKCGCLKIAVRISNILMMK